MLPTFGWGAGRKTQNPKPSSSLLSYQGFVCPLAGGSRGAGLVSMSSNSFRSRVKPALHVGKQIGGASGWRA
jgi:hypothetical protein